MSYKICSALFYSRPGKRPLALIEISYSVLLSNLQKHLKKLATFGDEAVDKISCSQAGPSLAHTCDICESSKVTVQELTFR